jgi:spore germination protein KB
LERLSTHQFTILSTAILLGTTFFPAGPTVAGIAGRDGWMAIFPGFSVGVPFALMVLSLMPKYPGMNLIEISEKVLGKWLGKGLGLIYIVVTLYFGAILSGQGVDLFNRTILPLMPRYVFVIGAGILVYFMFLNGIEVLSRFSEIVFPIVTAALILTALLSIPRFEQGELFPILADGIKPILLASIKIVPWPLELALFLAGLLPFLPKKPKEIKQMRAGIWRAFLVVIFLNTLIVLIQILTFGPFETKRLTYGLLVLGKMIEVSRALAGVESIFALIWMGALIIKISAFFFAGLWGIKSVLGFKNLKWGFPVLIIYLLIPLMYKRGIDVVVEIGKIDDYLILPFTTFWVILVWGVDKWKSRPKGS